ncbi:hypothetical protein H6F44_11710 [Pseudanabaena sp. FACHB-1277]|uniref:Uncharacterized protein n=1 Tax=Pseudanabaena cinerea FACHB-1277 TaxID=2949581 RepID=A0A926UTZ1_9CYAN|nr:hypothetical protein [Pseudanabaena cinerea]MBD2150781.1 hypothetical protein [Pseudanabaena cinerea FACHB-1277]
MGFNNVEVFKAIAKPFAKPFANKQATPMPVHWMSIDNISILQCDR